MQFNVTTSPYNGIIQGIERESRLGLGTISDNDAPDYYLTYFLNKINEWLHIVNHWIREINDEWLYDDENVSESILESYSFLDDIQSYDLDDDIAKIHKVEAHDTDKTDPEGWYNLGYYYQTDRIEDLYGQDSGKPEKYFFQGRKIIFDVPVDTSDADEYRITKQHHAHEFVIGDTNAEPGFDKLFHPILIYGPTMDWSMGKHKDIYDKCYLKLFGKGLGDPNALKTMLQEHYQNQNKDFKYSLKRKSVNYD